MNRAARRATLAECAPLHELLALLAPPTCTACRAPLDAAGPLLCPACARALPWLRGPGCPRCGLPRHRRSGCPAAGAGFALAWAPLAYDGVARELVQALKFRGALPVAQLMAAQVAAGLPPALRGVDAVVPVPPHPGRRRRRGFDPAGVLARALAARLGLPLAACLARGGGRRQVGAGEGSGAIRTGSRSARAGSRRAARCSSTTSTPPARRSTRARVRSPRAGAAGSWR